MPIRDHISSDVIVSDPGFRPSHQRIDVNNSHSRTVPSLFSFTVAHLDHASQWMRRVRPPSDLRAILSAWSRLGLHTSYRDWRR
jgi:hypothetical protein